MSNSILQRDTLSVSELNRKVRSTLETQFNHVWVEGEISNFSRPSSGHWYFTLKDSQAQIRCAMFRNRNSLIKPIPREGDKIAVRARVSLYEPRGDYQMIVEFMEAAGLGKLKQMFDALKERLNEEGLFDQSRKRPLPKTPQSIAIISSPTGAVVHDIVQVLKRRSPSILLTIIPTTVQGQDAPRQLIHALEKAENIIQPDLIIIGRGGGSLEDLWGFNDELLARRLSRCEIPIISAVGHETDFSICDFVADVRAPTPSAAAELASPDTAYQQTTLEQMTARIHRTFKQTFTYKQNQLKQAQRNLKHPGEKIREWQQRCDICEQQLLRIIQRYTQERRQRLVHYKKILSSASPSTNIALHQHKVAQFDKNLTRCIQQKLRMQKQALAHAAQALDIMSPLATLKRGYTYVKNESGVLLNSSKQCTANKNIKVVFHDGEIDAEVKSSKIL